MHCTKMVLDAHGRVMVVDNVTVTGAIFDMNRCVFAQFADLERVNTRVLILPMVIDLVFIFARE